MPIIGWYCGACGGREVPLDHFASTKCGETHVHPDYAQAVLDDRSDQRTGVRVTHGLGCPRRAAIEAHEDFHIDPLDLNAPLTGTAWHAAMERAADNFDKPGSSKNPLMEVEVEVTGTIDGIPVTGRIDRLRGDLIEDWKHGSDFSLKYKRAEGAKLEHRVQASVYAELAEQSGLPRPQRGIIWAHGSGSGAGSLFPLPFSLLPIAEALEVKPYGGSFTVAELYQQSHAALVERSILWQDLPTAGASQSFGNKTACDYCSVKSICIAADTGAPF